MGEITPTGRKARSRLDVFVHALPSECSPWEQPQASVLDLVLPPLLQDANEDIEDMSLTSVSKLGGTANVIDGIIKTQNELSGLECQPSTNQMSKLIGINEKPYVQVQNPARIGRGKHFGQFGLGASSVGRLHDFAGMVALPS